MKRIVICGSLSQMHVIEEIRDKLISVNGVDVIIPDPELDRFDAYMRHTTAIKEANLVVVLPKHVSEKTMLNTFPFRFGPNSTEYVKKEIDKNGIVLGEATTYELCIALSLLKPVIIISTNTYCDDYDNWLYNIQHDIYLASGVK